jgi:hypothetical protein
VSALVPANDRLKAGIEKIVRAVFGPRIDYLAPYAGTVKAQNGDGTLDVLPDDSKLPGLQGVPIDTGIPGVSFQIAVGARVLFLFVGGDPSKPRVTEWESASVTSVTVTSTNVIVASSSIKLGSSGAAQAFVLGTQYATHMTALATALQALQTAITPLMLPPAAAAAKAAALAAYNAATQLAGDTSTTIQGQ